MYAIDVNYMKNKIKTLLTEHIISLVKTTIAKKTEF